jgi:hypothetical protein
LIAKKQETKMSWLRKLMGLHAEPTPRCSGGANEVALTSYGERIISVPELDLMGQHHQSPNGRYRLIWQDAGWSSDRRDARGRYVLLADGQVTVDGRMDRPQDGKVCDAGIFVLNDWGQRDRLAGRSGHSALTEALSSPAASLPTFSTTACLRTAVSQFARHAMRRGRRTAQY